MIVVIAIVSAAMTRTSIRGDGKIVGRDPIADISDVAGVIHIGRITVRIEIDFPVGNPLWFVDGEFEAAIELQFRANDLIGKGGALDQLVTAVDVALADEIGNDVAAAFVQLLGRQLVRFVHEREVGRGFALGRSLVVIVIDHDAARTQQGEQAKNEGQKQMGWFHERAGMN